MKKNIFDPFMQINFDSAIKNTKPMNNLGETNSSIGISEGVFLEKRINFKTPQIVPGFVVLITSDSIGDSNKIGKTLLKDFLNELNSLVDVPEYIIFVNEAVKCIESNVSSLKNVKKIGTRVVVSKESLEFFNISSNFEFANKLSSSDIAKKMIFAKKLLKI